MPVRLRVPGEHVPARVRAVLDLDRRHLRHRWRLPGRRDVQYVRRLEVSDDGLDGGRGMHDEFAARVQGARELPMLEDALLVRCGLSDLHDDTA